MFIACAVVSVPLAVMVAMSGMVKLQQVPRVVDGITSLGVPLAWFPWLAGAQIAGGVGLVVGLVVAPIGVAAAAGLVAYFTGAIITHLRVGDDELLVPGLLVAASLVALGLRIATI